MKYLLSVALGMLVTVSGAFGASFGMVHYPTYQVKQVVANYNDWELVDEDAIKGDSSTDLAYVLSLKRAQYFEGFSNTPYLLYGTWHIGFGHRLDNPEDIPYLSYAEAYNLLEDDMKIVERELERRVPNYKHMPLEVRMVLLDMGFNMGVPRLKKFVKMFDALDNNDYAAAAQEIMDSRYFNQVKSRATENILMLVSMVKAKRGVERL